MRRPSYDNFLPPSTESPSRPVPPVRAVSLTFGRDVAMSDVADTLQLARLAADALYGPERVALEAFWQLDQRAGTVVIDTSTAPGRAFATIFLGYVRREFGERAVRVTRGSGGGVTPRKEVPR